MPEIRNFGRDCVFTPKVILTPSTEDELVSLLNRDHPESVRVIGSKHAWNKGIKTEDTVLDLKHLNHIEIEHVDEKQVVHVGAGCKLSRLLRELNKQGLTLPSIGLVTAQTVAGATATGTHGSGRPSLSHYIHSARIVGLSNGVACVREINGGDDLRAIRCSLGCLGVVVELTFPVVPQYNVEESVTPCDSLGRALAHEAEWPLQQLFLLPHKWKWYAQCRRQTDRGASWLSSLYRFYWFAGLNLGFIALIKFFASIPGGFALLTFFYRRIASALLITKWRVIDRSDKLLVLKHEIIRHSEMELFVQKTHIESAVSILIQILDTFANANVKVTTSTKRLIASAGLGLELESLRGMYTHDCPICIRRVLPDDTLISMASGQGEWYAISLISYAIDRTEFYKAMRFIGHLYAKCFDARPHWGKWLPLEAKELHRLYPQMECFRAICESNDPDGVFRNEFTERTLGLGR